MLALLASPILLAACGGGSDAAGPTAASSTATSPAAMPTDLCVALSDALAKTPELDVDTSTGAPSTGADDASVCTFDGDVVDLQVSATPVAANGTAGVTAALAGACAVLEVTGAGDVTRRSDACASSSGDTAPGEAVSVSELLEPAGVLVVQASSTADSGAILGAQLAKLGLALGSTLPQS